MAIELAYWQDILKETILRSGGEKAIAKVKATIREIEQEMKMEGATASSPALGAAQ